MSDICHACGQRVQQAHKESLSKQKLLMLQAAAAHVKVTLVNDFKKSDVAGMRDNSNYANFQKLRYHGLITQVKVSGYRSRDRWLITRNGWAFLRGELSLPKYVLVKNNHIVGRSDVLIDVRDVYYGSDVITTSFEYFDDDGKMVGFRPMRQEVKQVSLL